MDSCEGIYTTATSVVLRSEMYLELYYAELRALSHNSGTHFFLRGMNGARNVKFGVRVEGLLGIAGRKPVLDSFVSTCLQP